MSIVDEFSFSTASIGLGHVGLDTFFVSPSFRPSLNTPSWLPEPPFVLCLLIVVDSTLSFISNVNEGRAEHAYDFGHDILPTYLWTSYYQSNAGLDFRVY